MFLQQMEEVARAEAELLDLLSPGGWGRVVKEGKKITNPTTPIPLVTKARQTLENRMLRGGQEGLGSRDSFAGGCWQQGRYHGKEVVKNGGGWLLLSLLLTKQLCQLAVSKAWGFAIELLEGGGGCAGEGRGRAGPATGSNCCSCLPIAGKPGRGCAGLWRDAGKFLW